MTVEERLEKAIEFIKSIERLELPTLTTSDIVDSAHIYCTDCEADDGFDFSGPNNKYVEVDAVDELKDKAWHLLADIAM